MYTYCWWYFNCITLAEYLPLFSLHCYFYRREPAHSYSRRGEDRRGEDRRGEDRRGEDRRGEDRRGEDRRGEDRRGEDRRGEDRRGGGRNTPDHPAPAAYYDQLDGPVREGGGGPVPDLQTDFPTLGSQQVFATGTAKVGNKEYRVFKKCVFLLCIRHLLYW